MSRRWMASRRWTAAAILGATLGASSCHEEPEPELEIEILGCIDDQQPWMTCDEFCEWDGATCAENACGGITANYYLGPSACIDPDPYFDKPTPVQAGCSDPLDFGDPAAELPRYFNCCCDYR